MKYSGLSESSPPNVHWEHPLLGLSETMWSLLHQHSCDSSQMTEACTMEKPWEWDSYLLPGLQYLTGLPLVVGLYCIINPGQEWRVKWLPQPLGFSHSGNPGSTHIEFTVALALGQGGWRVGERSHGGTSTVSLEHYLEAPITVGSWSYHGHCMGPWPRFLRERICFCLPWCLEEDGSKIKLQHHCTLSSEWQLWKFKQYLLTDSYGKLLLRFVDYDGKRVQIAWVSFCILSYLCCLCWGMWDFFMWGVCACMRAFLPGPNL